VRAFLSRHGHVLMYVLITAAFLYAIHQANSAVRDLEKESAERRNQNCLIFEGDHLEDINQLKRTYEFLDNPKANRGLVEAVLPGLPALESKARRDGAPDYCDDPNVGLPEPDPVAPERRDFSSLLKP